MKVLAIGLLALSLSAVSVQAANVAQSLCEYVQADDKKRMRSFLKTNKLKIRRVFDGVQCNGENLLVFADRQGSVMTGTLIISKSPKKTVSKVLPKLTNDELIIAARDRVE